MAHGELRRAKESLRRKGLPLCIHTLAVDLGHLGVHVFHDGRGTEYLDPSRPTF